MDLYPQDLGTRWHVALVRRRALVWAGVDNPALLSAESPRPRLGPLGRIWSLGMDLKPESTAAALSAAAPFIVGKTRGPMIGGSFVTTLLLTCIYASLSGPDLGPGGFLLAWAGVAAGGLLALPRLRFQRLHRKPLTAAELEWLVPIAHDDLEMACLSLALDTLRQTLPGASGAEIRNALRSLSEAIARLPNVPPIPENTDALHAEASTLQARSASEEDPVIAESLRRRAEALEHLADVVDHSARVLRRSAALREELGAQARALRGSLTASSMGATDTRLLTQLSDAVRQVAAEAASVGRATDELDGFRSSQRAQQEVWLRLRGG